MTRIGLKSASEQLGLSEQCIRIGIQKKTLPIGFAFKNTGKNLTYVIYQEKIDQFIGKVGDNDAKC